MTLDEEVLLDVSKLNPRPIIINEWEPIADILSSSFNWKGSKIDWNSLGLHIEKPVDFKSSKVDKEVEEFIEKSGLSKLIIYAKNIYYVNDSSLDFAVSLNMENFSSFVIYAINNIPQHHYFFDERAMWCFAITTEGYLDLGVRG